MAVTLNSVISFNPTTNSRQVIRANNRVLLLEVSSVTSISNPVGLRQSMHGKRSRLYLVAAGGDNVATEASDKDSKSIEGSYSNDRLSDNVFDANSETTGDKIQSSGEVGFAPQVSETTNGAVSSTNMNNMNQEASTAKSGPTLKRAPLTARERLRAARVLSRYTDSKPSKPELGSKLLEVLKEGDKGKKRSGLPEAPTNLFDDSKRGLPKQGWTINLPGGMDMFFIIFSFAFISTVMFATTYIVWKVGAIHFNEY